MTQDGRPALAGLWRAHDALTRAGFIVGGAALAGIVAAFLIEVVARYFFNAPTVWSASAVAYLLCAASMLAMPELARTRGHIAISILEESLSPAIRLLFIRAMSLLVAAICTVAAWMIWSETLRQAGAGTTTSFAVRVPKVWLSGLICYGYTGTAIYYLRAAIVPNSLELETDSKQAAG